MSFPNNLYGFIPNQWTSSTQSNSAEQIFSNMSSRKDILVKYVDGEPVYPYANFNGKESSDNELDELDEIDDESSDGIIGKRCFVHSGIIPNHDFTRIISGKLYENITQLIITDANISNIDQINTPNLKYLDCSGNKISRIIPGQFPKLEMLIAKNNNLTEKLIHELDGNRKIKTLDVSYNNIAAVDVDLPMLMTLKILSNEKVSINFKKLPTLLFLHISGTFTDWESFRDIPKGFSIYIHDKLFANIPRNIPSEKNISLFIAEYSHESCEETEKYLRANGYDERISAMRFN